MRDSERYRAEHLKMFSYYNVSTNLTFQERSLPCIDKVKYLVPRELTLAQLSTIVRNRLSLNQAESFFLFSSGGVMVTMSGTVQELYAANMDSDGFLYIEYASQETFGASMHSTEGQL